MDTFDRLDVVFDVPSALSESTAVAVPPKDGLSTALSVTAENPDSIAHDVDRARDTLHELIDKGLEAVDGMLAIAKQSDHPRAFEVAGQLINSTAGLAKDLLEIQKRAQSLKEGPKQGKEVPSGPVTNHTTNIFAGTTRELMEAMRKANAQVAVVEAPE